MRLRYACRSWVLRNGGAARHCFGADRNGEPTGRVCQGKTEKQETRGPLVVAQKKQVS